RRTMEGRGGPGNELRSGRQAGHGLVVRDLETEEALAGDEAALHRDRALPRLQRQQLEAAGVGERPAHRAEEPRGVGRHQRGAVLSLPARGLQGEEVLDRLRVVGSLHRLDACTKLALEEPAPPPELAARLAAERGADVVVDVAPLQSRALEAS